MISMFGRETPLDVDFTEVENSRLINDTAKLGF